MAKAGDGYRFHVTGLTHDERGYPVMNAAGQEKLRPAARRQDPAATPTTIVDCRGGRRRGRRGGGRLLRHHLARRPARPSSWRAQRGVKVGMLRLITVWPFPEKRIRELARAGPGASSCPR